jgi:hypothetical protein
VVSCLEDERWTATTDPPLTCLEPPRGCSVWWQVDNSTLRISATPDVARSELERFVDGMSETDTTGWTSFVEGKRRFSFRGRGRATRPGR